MPRYDFRCDAGHQAELEYPMAVVPPTVPCGVHGCALEARRVFTPPIAIHFRGGGFYATDVNGKVRRRRRKNAGDDLPLEFDHGAAAIADAL